MISSNQNMLFPISEFFYKLIRVLFHSPTIKSDNEISKFSHLDMECPRRFRPFLLPPLSGCGSHLRIDTSSHLFGL